MNCNLSLTDLRDIILALCGVAMAAIALYGVNRGLRIWRVQLRERVEFDLARRILTSLNRIRTLMSGARWGGVNGNEFPKNDSVLLREGEEHNVLEERGERHRRQMLYVFQRRTRPIRNEVNKLWGLIEEAEAFWGHDIRSALQLLIVHVNKLALTVERRFSSEPAYQGDEFMQAQKLIFGNGDSEDSYNAELVERLEAIAAIVRKNMSSLRDSGS